MARSKVVYVYYRTNNIPQHLCFICAVKIAHEVIDFNNNQITLEANGYEFNNTRCKRCNTVLEDYVDIKAIVEI